MGILLFVSELLSNFSVQKNCASTDFYNRDRYKAKLKA